MKLYNNTEEINYSEFCKEIKCDAFRSRRIRATGFEENQLLCSKMCGTNFVCCYDSMDTEQCRICIEIEKMPLIRKLVIKGILEQYKKEWSALRRDRIRKLLKK